MASEERKEYSRQLSQNIRDTKNTVKKIGKPANPKLRKRVSASLPVFLTEIFPDLFCDPFGAVQLDSIKQEEYIHNAGVGNLLKLEPRGFGKSVRSILGVVWACLTGRQDFAVVCCDSTEKADDLLKLAMMALSENQLLLDCFPELSCFHALDGNSFRCKYQLYEGNKTKISIKGDTICFPVLGEGLPSEGAIIVARPYKKTRGKNIEGRRPSLVILDDVQSTEDAMSPTTVAKLMQILTTDIALLGSKRRPVAIINNATVIRDGDFPTQVSKLNAFTTVRYKMMTTLPDDQELWEEYHGIRQAFSSETVGDRARAEKEALEFYVANRKAMDKGAEPTWEYAYSTGKNEISSVQAAMNFIADFGRASFNSECQNDPQEDQQSLDLLTVDEIAAKTNKCPANIVPLGHGTLVAFIDVHDEILDYEVWAFNERFGGSKVLGGTWPDQGTQVFTHTDPPRPLSYKYPNMTTEGRLDIALDDLFDFLLGREWVREDETPMRIARCLVDANGTHSDTIKKTCRNSEYAALLTPSYGMGITARKLPISRLPNNKGRRDIGPEWAPKKASPGEIPSVIFDANYWKTRFHSQLSKPKGEHGSLLLHEGPPGVHKRSAEGYRAEKAIEVTANGRTVKEWQLMPNRENHPFDCAVGCMVAASMCGVADTRQAARPQRKRRRLKV